MADFKDYISTERERLTKQRDDVLAQQQKISSELAAIDRELLAISAYEQAKSGKQDASGKSLGRPRKAGAVAGRKRAPRGSRQEAVLGTIKKTKNGATRGEIILAMGLKGDKSGEQAVSNALVVLKKTKKVKSKDGRYMTP